MKSLHDELYLITDKDVQSNTLAMIKNILNYTRENHPSENGIALKDKSLSPKKSTTCKGKRNRKRFPLCTLAKRKKKNSFQKRFGTAADQRNAKLNVGETKVAGVAKRKRVGAVLETGITCKKTRNGVQRNRGINVEELPDQNVPDDHAYWVNIHGINLTFRLKDILLSKHGWLTDEHIDAAQYLMRELGTGVGGLICVPAMTYSCSRFAVVQDPNQVIQCHNIGGHWVTSSSTTGNILVYESLSTSLNDSLKQQLVHLYRGLQKDDGSLEITVVLQQRQKGGLDCGLFCIANAMALASGINPCSISWSQNSMRGNLLQCFQQKRMELFTHVPKHTSCHESHYVVSIYCLCLKHILYQVPTW